MKIVFFLFEGLTALDAVGPYEILSRVPSAEVVMAGTHPGPVRTDNGFLTLHADLKLSEIPSCDLLVIPGGIATSRLERDGQLSRELRRLDETTRITASVCTGAMLLAAAGLLAGRRATTHFGWRERLAAYDVRVVDQRVVRDGKYMTGAGVSAGLDLALALVAELTSDSVAQAIQLAIEYDPKPPFRAGHPDLVPAAVRELVLGMLREREAARSNALP